MHRHKIWISRVSGIVLVAAVLAAFFISWQLGLVLFILWILLLIASAFILDQMSFDTRKKWTIPSIIHLNDMRQLRKEDKERLAWMHHEGEYFRVTDDNGHLQEGLLLLHPDAKGLIFACHGYGDYAGQSIQLPAKRFYEMGYSVFLPKGRGFGRYNGSWTSMGVLERDDHIYWLNKIMKHYPNEDIFLYGVSMGAACVMNLCDFETNGQIRGIIEDCGYISLPGQLKHSMNFLVGMDPFPLYPITKQIVRLRPGFEIDAMQMEDKLSRSKYPILAFHGEKDDFVPFSNLEKVRQAAGDHLIKAIPVPGAAHCQSYNVATDMYFDEIQAFLDQFASGTNSDIPIEDDTDPDQKKSDSGSNK